VPNKLLFCNVVIDGRSTDTKHRDHFREPQQSLRIQCRISPNPPKVSPARLPRFEAFEALKTRVSA
jgi:hypothetical protein